MNVKIGNDAGLVWAALEGKGEVAAKSLAKTAKLKKEELYLALGWLAREGKLNFTETDADLVVSLT